MYFFAMLYIVSSFVKFILSAFGSIARLTIKLLHCTFLAAKVEVRRHQTIHVTNPAQIQTEALNPIDAVELTSKQTLCCRHPE